MILAFVVVISHVTTVLALVSGDSNVSLFGDFDFVVESDPLALVGRGVTSVLARVGALVLPLGRFLVVVGGVVVAWVGALALPITRFAVVLGKGSRAVSVVSLGYVDASVNVNTGRLTRLVVAIVHAIFNVDLSVGVTPVGLAVVASDTISPRLSRRIR